MPLLKVNGLTYNGAQVAFFVTSGGSDIEVPMRKVEIEKAAEATESTGSTSVSGGKTWADYGEGNSSWTWTADAVWRVGQSVNPPDFQQGNTYAMKFFMRRPGWNNAQDPGSFWGGNGFVERNRTVLEPKSGVIAWTASGKGQGALSDPT